MQCFAVVPQGHKVCPRLEIFNRRGAGFGFTVLYKMCVVSLDAVQDIFGHRIKRWITCSGQGYYKLNTKPPVNGQQPWLLWPGPNA